MAEEASALAKTATQREAGARIARRLKAVAPALLVAVPAAFWVWDAMVRASWASLGRDQGIFQYVAWAVGEGDVAYRDIRDVNGPLIMMVHSGFQLLGGGDEHRFRVLDLSCTGLSFVVAGALVPSIRRPRVTLWERAAWALAAWVALGAGYVLYGFWDTAQRESFLDWFVLVSVVLQATQHGSGDARDAKTKATLFIVGFLSLLPWLGKPTFGLFTVAQVLALVLEREPLQVRFRRLLAFLTGGVVGVSLPIAYVASRGDLASWARITFVDVPTMYRFIWPRPAWVILSMPGYFTLAWMAVVTSAGLVASIVLRRLPLRALPIAVMPVLGLASVVLQAKGFPYHFHPVTLGVTLGWLVALAMGWEAARSAKPSVRVNASKGLALVAAIIIGARAGYFARSAPFPAAPDPESRDRDSLESAERLSAFDRIDYFPRAMRDAAAYVAAHTRPEERVQTYGMDAYLLFLAGRRSATPYIYAYDLNADAAMHGSFDPGGLAPTAEQVERIRSIRDEHARDLTELLQRSPPAAFVFVDRSPLMSSDDSVADFSAHCPAAAAWLTSHYREAADFEGIRVWLPTSGLPLEE